MPEIIKNAVEIELSGIKYIVDVIKWEYINNRMYLALYDTEDGELVADITDNFPEIKDEILQNWLENGEGERAILNHDFVFFMGWARQAKIWLMDNIKNCIGGWDVEGLPAIVLFNN